MEDAVDAGVYVLIDWHIHADPSHYTEEAVAFFSEQARHHGHLPNVIYEICNEPAGVGWSEVIKPYAEQVIAAIREHDPDNIILVGTPGLSRNIDEAIADPLPPELGSVMYALHYYTGEQDLTTMQEKAAAAQDAGMAVFVSSWKASSYDMNPVDYARAEQWAAFMEERDISWVYWGLNNKDEPASLLKPTASMAGPWDEDDLTENGQWWYQRLRPRP
ncbi:MAG: endoglucanase [Myxococcota bacterium]